MSVSAAVAVAIDLFAVRDKSMFDFGAVHSVPQVSFAFDIPAPGNLAIETSQGN